MKTPIFLPWFGLLSLMLCGFGSCGKSTKLSDPPPVECGTMAFENCDPPVGLDGGTLGKTEVDDVKNRAAWHVCVLRHLAALECLQKAENAGYIKK